MSMRERISRFSAVPFYVMAGAIVCMYLVPLLCRWVDAHRFAQDVAFAERMTIKLASEHMHQGEPLTAASVKQWLADDDGTIKTQSFHTGFFYVEAETRLVAWRFSEALAYHNPDQIDSPEEVFGQGIFLLDTEGSTVSETIKILDMCANGGRCVSRLDALERRWNQTLVNWMGLHVFKWERYDEVVAVTETLTNYYSPEQTVFIGNNTWFTAAQNSQDITRIVFAQGIVKVPTFALSYTHPCAVHFELVTLPATVRTLERNAFGRSFCIERLDAKGETAISVEPGTLQGVERVLFLSYDLTRDDPIYEITALFQGQPLVTYDPDTLTTAPAVNIKRLIAYLSNLDVQAITYTIAIDHHDFSKTRVYVFDDKGYYGFVIPVPE